MLNPLSRRSLCLQCHRPVASCICRWAQTVANLPEVIILQHPLEVHQAKGSARLLMLCLQNAGLLEGEAFDEAPLQTVLHAGGLQPVLLYPATDTSEAADLLFKPAAFDMSGQVPANIRLIILDATWRKSRKMLYLNPILQQLPRMSLQDMPASHYRIRKAHAPDQLSTLEATCYALMELERDEAKYQPLLQAFDGFVGQQMALSTPA